MVEDESTNRAYDTHQSQNIISKGAADEPICIAMYVIKAGVTCRILSIGNVLGRL